MRCRVYARVVGGCLVGWLVTASGVLANDVCLCATKRPAGQINLAPGADRGIDRPAAQLRDVRLSVTRNGGGLPVVRLAGHGVEFLKTVQTDGRFQLTIRAADDQLTITGEPEMLVVDRFGRTVFVNMRATDDGSLDQARTLLADSKALRQFRMLAHGLSPVEAASPAGVAVQLTATYFSVLDGDLGAARRFSSRREKPGVAAPTRSAGAMSSEEEIDGEKSCYQRFEEEAVAAMDDYDGCVASFWWNPPLRDLCGYIWMLRAEAAWFEFLKCVGIRIT